MMIVLETARLLLRRISVDDAAFILELLNEPSFLQFVGDKGVRTLDDARDYIRKGPIASYERFGFGLYLTLLKDAGVPIGICGLVKRESLMDADIGFAFMPAFWSQGYAFEAASAVMAHARRVCGLQRLVAIASPGNAASVKLLEKLGLTFERMVTLSEDGVELTLHAARLG
jgi:RimJ/RimL family protein N-acetyltransferase